MSQCLERKVQKSKLTLFFVNTRTPDPWRKSHVREEGRHTERKRKSNKSNFSHQIAFIQQFRSVSTRSQGCVYLQNKVFNRLMDIKNKLLWQNVINVKGKMMRVI